MNVNKSGLALLLAASSIVHAAPAAANKPSVPVATPVTAPAPAPAPLTIGELSAQARQKRIADETKPAAPTVPPGMTIVPSTEIVTNGAGAATAGKGTAPPKKAKPAPPPEVVPGLLAIAKTNAGARFAELADKDGSNKYVSGQVTPSGWTVMNIGVHFVELSKPAEKKKPARHLTLSLTTQ